MTSSSIPHQDRLAALLARTGMVRASELPEVSPLQLARPQRAAWVGEERETRDQTKPSWLPSLGDIGREVIEFRIDPQADSSLAVVPVVRRTTTAGPSGGRRIYRWDDVWDARQLQAVAPGGLDALAMQVVTLHDAACMAWTQDDRAAASRFALAAVQAVIADQRSIEVSGHGQAPLPIRRGAAGVAVVEVPGGWAFTLHDRGQIFDPAHVRGVGAPPICGGVWLVASASEVVALTVAPAIVRALARTAVRRDGELSGLDALELVDAIEALRREGIEPRIDDGLDIARVASAGRIEMRLANFDGLLYVSLRVAPFGDAATWVPGVGEAVALTLRNGDLVRCERNLASETDRALALCNLLGLTPSLLVPFCWCFEQTQAALDFLSRLQAQSASFVLRWDTAPITIAQAPPDLTLRVPSGVDWLGGKLQVDDSRVELRALLEAMRDGRRFVEVRGGVWMEIRSRLRRQLRQVVAHVEQSAQEGPQPSAALARWNRVRHLLSEGVAFVADTADASGVRAARDAAVERLDARYRAAMATAVEPPTSLRAELRPYQREGVAFLVRTAAWAPGALLADDMGLGKTVQALAFLLHRAQEGGALVIAPASVLCVWQREAAQFAPSLRVRMVDSAGLRRSSAPQAQELWLCSWAGLTRHVDLLACRIFTTIVYDEAQMAKNPDTARAKAARTLRAGFSLLLSGTPVENRVLELWSLFSIAVPGLLGERRAFFESVAAPIEQTADLGVAQQLASLVAPFWLRRTKAQVAADLPARIEVDVPVILSAAERKQYEIVRGAALEVLHKRDREERTLIFAAMTRLRQLACHPRLVDPRSTLPSAKLERAMELLKELRAEGHRCLVFSQFTGHLDLVAEAMRSEAFRILRLDGRTSAAQRKANVASFQAGDADAMLVSLGAGGTGLTLTAADSVILLDPWWNPAAEAQAADRVHRIGQRRVVTIYRLISQATVETKVRQLQLHKARIAGTILDQLAGPVQSTQTLDRRTLQAILGDDDDALEVVSGNESLAS